MSTYPDSSQLKALYEGWPTEKLIDAAARTADYQPEAIALIQAELARRQIADSVITTARQAIANTPPIDKIRETFEERKRSLLGNRFGAFFTDLVLSYSILLLANLVLGDRVYGQTLFVWLGLFAAYYVFFEGRYGITPGKKLVGLKVVTTSLGRCGYGRATVRFVLRIIECFLAPIIALIAFLSTERRQRIGDLLARTLVVRTEDLQ